MNQIYIDIFYRLKIQSGRCQMCLMSYFSSDELDIISDFISLNDFYKKYSHHSKLLQANNYLPADPLNYPQLTILLKPQNTLSPNYVHICANHDFKRIFNFFSLLIFHKSWVTVVNRVYFDHVQTLMMNLNEVRLISPSYFNDLRNQVQHLFVYDSKLMFLIETMPPCQFDSQTDFFVDFSLTTQYSFGTFNALLNVFSDFFKRISQRLIVLFYQGKNVFYVHLIQELLLEIFHIFVEHINSERLKLIICITCALMNCWLAIFFNMGPCISSYLWVWKGVIELQSISWQKYFCYISASIF